MDEIGILSVVENTTASHRVWLAGTSRKNALATTIFAQQFDTQIKIMSKAFFSHKTMLLLK